MLPDFLEQFYHRDLQQFISEPESFQEEENSWKTVGSIRNSAGNLALHVIGGMNYLIGTLLENTKYVREREQEFLRKDVERNRHLLVS